MQNFKIFLIFLLFICTGVPTLGAEVSVHYTTVAENCNKEGWWVEYKYISRIVVVKEVDQEVRVNLNSSEFMKAWNTNNNMVGNEGSFKNTIKGDIEDKKITLNANGSSRDNNNKYFEITESKADQKDISLKVKKIKNGRPQKSDRIGMTWSRELYIPANVANGAYSYYFETDLYGHKPPIHGVIQVTSLPEVTVEDIDFGIHPSDALLVLQKEADIIIEGGTPNIDYQLNTDPVVNLIKAGTSEGIPVNMAIEYTHGQRLDSSGNSSAKLKADIDTVAPSTPGTYTGTATVTFNYN